MTIMTRGELYRQAIRAVQDLFEEATEEDFVGIVILVANEQEDGQLRCSFAACVAPGAEEEIQKSLREAADKFGDARPISYAESS